MSTSSNPAWKGNMWGVYNGEGKYFGMVPQLIPVLTKNGTLPVTAKFPKSRPLKIYRKRLTTSNGISGASMIHGFNAPMSSTYLTSFDGSNCTQCAGDDASNYFLQYHGDKAECNRCYTEACGDSSGNSFRCERTSEDHMGARPATTVISKDYYQTMSAYLRAKGMTYNQKQTVIPIAGRQYVSPNCPSELLPATSASDGPQEYKTGTCENGNVACNRTIYKPNNKQFMTQGAVSASARIEKLKYDTNRKNKCSRVNGGTKCVLNLPTRSYVAGMTLRPGHATAC